MQKQKKRLILINPVNEERKGFALDRSSRYPPLGLAIIAALTPKDWYIRIIDENFQPFRYRDADLVGITSFTSTAPRAYKIAQVYREKGVPTVLGGIHASMMPDEALNYVDTVVTGEAEKAWPRVIEDFLGGKLQRRYNGEMLDLKYQPLPRHDLFHPGYIFSAIQTSRGCPFNCEFCTVTAFNGSIFRERPIDQVIKELEAVPKQNVVFVDDNICGYGKRSRERAITLFKEMISRDIRKKWFSQASLNFADDDELLHYAAKSGCQLIAMGIEVETNKGLTEFNKKINLSKGVENYNAIFKKIQKHGIKVLGNFMFGLDTDYPEDLENRIKYILKSRLDAIQISILTPMPGTQVYQKMIEENRLGFNNFPDDWRYYHGGDVVFHPKNMLPTELAMHFRDACDKIYSRKALLLRLGKSLLRNSNVPASLWAYGGNVHYRNMTREKEVLVFPE